MCGDVLLVMSCVMGSEERGCICLGAQRLSKAGPGTGIAKLLDVSVMEWCGLILRCVERERESYARRGVRCPPA